MKAQRVSLIEKGQLVSYLIGRQPIRDFPASNGHGRAAAAAAPAPHPGNLVLQSTDPQPDAGLKAKLIELCKNRDLPYGLYVETMGPRSSPGSSIASGPKMGTKNWCAAACLEISTCARCAAISSPPEPCPPSRTALRPVWFSVASPALLFDELQVKRSQAAKQKLPEYPAPALTQAAGRP